MNLEISTWLAQPDDYAAGVALYAQHGPSGMIKRLLATGCTSYTREVVQRELAKLATHQVPTSELVGANLSAPAVIAADPLQALHQARRDAFAQRDYQRAQLELVATDDERLTMALDIMHQAEFINQTYEAEAHFNAHGALPAPPVAPEPAAELATLTNAGEIKHHLALLRTRRSKLQNRPDRAADYAQVLADIALLESLSTTNAN